MIRGILRLGLVGAGIGYAVDRLLAETAGRETPEPIHSMVVIDAPIQQVWEALVDIAGQPRWMHDMKSVRMDGDGPVGVGSTGEAVVRIMGIPVVDPVTITEHSAPTRFALTHDGLFKGGSVFDLESGADGTTTIVRWDETLVPPVLPHLGAAIGTPILAAVFQADLDRLRRLVETGSADDVAAPEADVAAPETDAVPAS